MRRAVGVDQRRRDGRRAADDARSRRRTRRRRRPRLYHGTQSPTEERLRGSPGGRCRQMEAPALAGKRGGRFPLAARGRSGRTAGPGEVIGIAAERVAHQRQIEAAAGLRLPDMGHFVDEQALPAERLGEKSSDHRSPCGMEVDVAGRRHRRCLRLERPPFALDQPDLANNRSPRRTPIGRARFRRG